MNAQTRHNSLVKPIQYFLAVDIGGTNLRICGCRYETAHKEVIRVWKETVPSGDLQYLRNTLIQAANRMLDTEQAQCVDVAIIGVPGKVSKDRRSAALTYLNPSEFVDIAAWLESVGVETTKLFNDLECGVYGIQTATLSQFSMLSEHQMAQVPDSYLLGVTGTGMGVGYWTKGTPQATEGGHGLVVCNPDNPVENLIWHELCQMNPVALPVYDDLVCGPGLAALANMLTNQTATSYPKPDLSSISDTDLPEMLSRWANDPDIPSENRDLAQVVFHYFGTFLGRALQLPLLTTLPDALFLSGSIIQANIPHFREQFLRVITSHRYHEKWLKSLPIAVVNHSELNLNGAVEAAKQMILGKENRNSP